MAKVTLEKVSKFYGDVGDAVVTAPDCDFGDGDSEFVRCRLWSADHQHYGPYVYPRWHHSRDPVFHSRTRGS